MSQKLYRFEFDEILVGKNGAVLCRNAERFVVRGIDLECMRLLNKLRKKSKVCSLEMLSIEKKSQLISLGLISTNFDLNVDTRKFKPFELSADSVARIATLIFPLGTSKGLFCLLFFSLIALILLPKNIFHSSTSFIFWLTNATSVEFLISSIVLFLCVCIHELGHATACLVNTGTVGGVRFKSYRGSPALAIDVSSIVFTDRRGKATIALAGVIFQLAITTFILLFPVPKAVEWGCRLSLFTALFSLSPLPKTDGYWFLSDVIGRRLSPKLFFPSNFLDLIFSLTTFIVFIFGIYSLSLEMKGLFLIGIGQLTSNFLRGCIFLMSAVYAVYVGFIFSWKMFQLFLYGKEN